MKKSRVRDVKKRISLVFLLGFASLGLALFLPAGTLHYWQAWLFIGTLFTPLVFVLLYFLKNNPEFLERRMRYREKETKEKIMITIAQPLFLLGFPVAGFDFRYGWSSVPSWLVIASDIVIFLAYMLVFLVFKENSYASRIVEVEKRQKVITTGPYSVVRHPMYAGVIPMYLCMPLALGSYAALIFFITGIIVIFFRILDEERLLLRDLKGYKDYVKKVKYRLVPGVW